MLSHFEHCALWRLGVNQNSCPADIFRGKDSDDTSLSLCSTVKRYNEKGPEMKK